MKKLFLLLAVVGMTLTACSEGGVDDDINNGGGNTEQPGGGEDGGEDNPDIPADKTQAIKFQDANTKLICTLHWDKNGDGELSYEEAAAVTNLYTAFKDSSILAFTELKYFTSLEKVGDSAFSGCSSLVIVTIPDSVTEIGYDAFRDCSNLKSVIIPDSVTEIGESAFNGCSSLESVYCNPTTPPSIEYDVFDNNASSRKIYVPAESVETYKTAEGWSDYAYSIVGYNFEIGEVIKPTTPYNNQIWYTTTDVMEFNPHDMTGFGANLIDNIYVGGNGVLLFDGDVTTIGEKAFYECSSLTSIAIPDSVTEIGEGAFYWCSSLTSITIPDSVTTIGEEAFYRCSSLTSINIPDGVKTIGKSVFEYCSSLTSITIPDSVTTIGEYAFSGCSSLESVTIPDNVTAIGAWAFSGCSSLTSITIPDSVTTIGYEAFAGCSSLTSVTIPESVTEIGEWAFAYCSSLESVYCKPITPPSIDDRVFDNNASGRKIYVPAESVAAYQTAEGWSDYADSIVSYEF